MAHQPIPVTALSGGSERAAGDGRWFQVQPAITIPANALSITIGRDGVVSVTQQGRAAPVPGWAAQSHHLYE